VVYNTLHKSEMKHVGP